MSDLVKELKVVAMVSAFICFSEIMGPCRRTFGLVRRNLLGNVRCEPIDHTGKAGSLPVRSRLRSVEIAGGRNLRVEWLKW